MIRAAMHEQIEALTEIVLSMTELSELALYLHSGRLSFLPSIYSEENESSYEFLASIADLFQ